MAQNTFPKCPPAASYPVHIKEASGLFKRVEPLLTPKLFRSRYLKGIQEIILDKLGVKYSNEELKDFINRAGNKAELLLNTTLIGERFTQKEAYDQNLYASWIYTKVSKKPVLWIDSLSIKSANGDDIFKLPPDWIDMGKAHLGIIVVVPLLAFQSQGGIVSAPYSGSPGYSLLHSRLGVNWIPSYWEITYGSGLACSLSEIPVPVNDLIGVLAALDILSAIGPLNMYTSVALSQDGISQSSANAGPQLFALRMQELEARKQELINAIKKAFTLNIHVSSL